MHRRLDYRTVTLREDGRAIRIIDQTRLPQQVVFCDLETQEQIRHAIYTLQVRGAPAIGVTAAYGLALAAGEIDARDHDGFMGQLADKKAYLAAARPTAVNLFWALDEMETFAAGESDILVSTTVVEVGVDVPNATCMVVENAERFGLSQLHQLRGRVGRGQAKSYCILLSEHPSEETRRRLKVMTRTNNGFEISQEDLQLRGPGDFFGQRQHGLPTLKIADLACDMQLLEEAQSAARALLRRDEDLSRPEHRPLLERVRELFHDTADSMN